ncbi:hypothetical protein ACG04Q_05250 [Roseateles sp. DXS20W]|uniref:Uncharacterized protein n=1 Tax=Pelomonas lactea TaxID=3299030 RepID=A0ABW7GG97_9BURK
MTILCVDLDLANSVFARQGVSEAGKIASVRPATPRDPLHELHPQPAAGRHRP